MCQRPERASLISTVTMEDINFDAKLGVNALNGLL